MILLVFGLILGVIDWGQLEYSDNDELRQIGQSPIKEYFMLHKLLLRIFHILRLSLGDFNFEAMIYLDEFDNHLYWSLYFLALFLTCIIFMNFIIAEVGASYNEIRSILFVKLLQERGEMINEAEDMLRTRFHEPVVLKWNHLFPKYLIKRELSE